MTEAEDIIRSGFENNIRFASEVPRFQRWVIPGMVTIDITNRELTYEPGYEPDEAARTFWEALIGQQGIIEGLRADNERMHLALASIATGRVEHSCGGFGCSICISRDALAALNGEGMRLVPSTTPPERTA